MAAIGGTNTASWKKKARNVVGWIVGAAVGSYSGINLLIPLGFTGGAWWIGKKLLRPEKLLFLSAIAVQTGHLIWLTLGLLILGALDANLVDVVVLVVGLTWLFLKPGLGPIVLLTLFQLFALAVNSFAFADAVIGTNPHKALLVHIIWRILGLYFMWHAYIQFRKVAPVETTSAGS